MDNTIMKKENDRKQAGKQTETKRKTSENFGKPFDNNASNTDNLPSHLHTV